MKGPLLTDRPSRLLRDFIDVNRDVILTRARSRVAGRNAPVATEIELTEGLKLFLQQLRDALSRASLHEVIDHADIHTSAAKHGHDLFRRGVTIAQVVHDYGDLCQVITGLAIEQTTTISAHEFQTLNLCLDDAIAGAVTEYSLLHENALTHKGTERLGVLAHEMRNALSAAMLSFASIKKGTVAPGGSTSALHDRSLMRLNTLIDRSLAEVRLDAALLQPETLEVWELLEECEIAALLAAEPRGLKIVVTHLDHAVVVQADRQILAAAITNLVQNAIKFTARGGTVCLRATTTNDRVLIEVEDECGGLPPGQAETLLQPFYQGGADRSGLGLGLSICLRAVQASAGQLLIRDLPTRGCVFTIDLPKSTRPPRGVVQRFGCEVTRVSEEHRTPAAGTVRSAR